MEPQVAEPRADVVRNPPSAIGLVALRHQAWRVPRSSMIICRVAKKESA
jgi:hypothetical protein